MSAKKLLLSMPYACLIGFVAFYILAALQYPGGSYVDPDQEGFSWTSNYYSDLFHRHAHNSQVNDGRPLAFFSLTFLVLTFFSLWIILFNFWHKEMKTRTTGNIIGVLIAFSLSSIVYFHDIALVLLMLNGIIGFICLIFILYIHNEIASLLITVLLFTGALTNFILWALPNVGSNLPLLQNVVLLIFGVWVLFVNTKVLIYNK